MTGPELPDVSDHPRRLTLRLTTLGAVELRAGEPDGSVRPLLGAGKPTALLAYLALSPRRTASRDSLIDLLWSNTEPEQSRRNLRQCLFLLRRLLGDEALVSADDELTLAAPLEVDRDAFLAALEAGDAHGAAALYTGPFFPSFAAPGGADFEQWADLERQRLHAAWVRTIEALIRQALHGHHGREAVHLAQRLLAADPAREASQRLLLESVISTGEWLLAAAEADRIEATLRAEGRVPEPATAALLLAARQVTDGGPPPPEAAFVAELVGRESEFARILEAWTAARAGAPVHVHVVGTAGIGKTRLLAEAAARLAGLGARVVPVRARQGERAVPFAAAADLVRALAALPGAVGVAPASAAVLVGLDPALSARFAAATGPLHRPEDLPRVRALALTDLVAAVAEEQSLAVFVDDVHWADAESRHLLAALSGRPAGRSFLLVTSARPLRESLAVGEPGTALTLRPLTVAEVAALLESVAVLPPALREAGFVEALHASSDGIPMAVMETLRLALDRGWLSLEGDRWASPDAQALVAQLGAGSALERRLETVSAPERTVLILLAAAEDPVPAAVVSEAATALGVVAEPALEALERRGFAIGGADRWAVAHDLIAERALAAAEPAALLAARRALGGAEAARAAERPAAERAAVRHLGRTGDVDALRRLFRAHERRARRAGEHAPAPALARDFLGPEHERLAPDLVRSLPFARRWQLTAPRRVLPALAVMIVAALGWAGRDLVQARPDHLVILQQPDFLVYSELQPPLVVEVATRRGHPAAADGESVTVQVAGPSAYDTSGRVSAPVIAGRATIARLPTTATLDPLNPGSGALTLRVRSAGLAPVLTDSILTNPRAARLVIDSVRLSGYVGGTAPPRLELAPRATITGTLALRYTTVSGHASVLLVAVPTWGDRTRDFVPLAALWPMARDRTHTVRLSIPGPGAPGRYRLILLFAEETEARFVASGTNWLLGTPVWRDGNDVVDWSPRQLDEAARTGHTTTSWQQLPGGELTTEGLTEAALRERLGRMRSVYLRDYPVAAAVLDVEVRAPAGRRPAASPAGSAAPAAPRSAPR